MKKLISIRTLATISFCLLMMSKNVSAQTTPTDYWRTRGNTNAQLLDPDTLSFAGTVDSISFILKACNVECVRMFCNGTTTFNGTVTAPKFNATEAVFGGVVEGHVKTDADTTTAAPAKCEIWPDNQGKNLIQAIGNLNTMPVMDIRSSYQGSYHVNAINAYTYPIRGYGYAVNAQGGKAGVYATGISSNFTGSTYGLYATSAGTGGARYGVYSSVSTGSTRYAIYGYAGSTTNSWAGYFNGNLQYTGSLIGPSDRKLKRDITPVLNVSEKLCKLLPVSYHFKQEEFPTLNFPTTLQFGLIADDVEKVFPELVVETFHANSSIEGDDSNAGGVSYKGINYISFIPLIIESVKEQQQQIKNLTEENQLLKDKLTAIENMLYKNDASTNKAIENVSASKAVLEQNDPNPFSQSTTMRYSLPLNFNTALITIYSSTGSLIKSISLEHNTSSVTLDARSFSPGIYMYVLMLNGKSVDSKQMVITR